MTSRDARENERQISSNEFLRYEQTSTLTKFKLFVKFKLLRVLQINTIVQTKNIERIFNTN